MVTLQIGQQHAFECSDLSAMTPWERFMFERGLKPISNPEVEAHRAEFINELRRKEPSAFLRWLSYLRPVIVPMVGEGPFCNTMLTVSIAGVCIGVLGTLVAVIQKFLGVDQTIAAIVSMVMLPSLAYFIFVGLLINNPLFGAWLVVPYNEYKGKVPQEVKYLAAEIQAAQLGDLSIEYLNDDPILYRVEVREDGALDRVAVAIWNNDGWSQIGSSE